MRKRLTIGLIIGGFVLMFVGFVIAAPWGSSAVADSDPRVIGAPIVFLLGIATVLAAAILYEVLPDRRE